MISLGDFRQTLRGVKDQSVDLVLSDPPYGNEFKHTRNKFKKFQVTGDDLVFLPDLFGLVDRVLKLGAPIILFCDHKGWLRFQTAASTAGFKLQGCAVWNKCGFGIGYHFRPMHEFIMLFAKRTVMARTRNLPSILDCPRVGNKEHPTQKPTALLELLITNFCRPLGLVLDPFMGSGSTAVACINTGRKFRGSELDPKWHRLAERRVKEARAA